MSIRIPLRTHNGIVGYAVVDDADARLADLSWHIGTKGYVEGCHKINGKYATVRMSRMVLGLAHGDPLVGDHIDFDKLNNQRSNLRAVTQAFNIARRKGANKQNATGRRGVTLNPRSGNRRRYVVQVGCNYHLYYGGSFNCIEEADRAAHALRAKLGMTDGRAA